MLMLNSLRNCMKIYRSGVQGARRAYDEDSESVGWNDPHTRHILEECYLHEKKYKEVAAELNISISCG